MDHIVYAPIKHQKQYAHADRGSYIDIYHQISQVIRDQNIAVEGKQVQHKCRRAIS